MPVDMRLLTRIEGPVEDTPPSTRPSSSASTTSSSTSGLPHRSTSMDSIPTDKDKTNVEVIPTRHNKIEPKANTDAGRFIKIGPANLHLTAKQQLEKVAKIKANRKPSVHEEEDWQTRSKASFDDGQDWQVNLDKWKNSRRKMNEEAIERVIRVKETEQLGSNPLRRKSMTLRGRIKAHDDDNNDISELLTPTTDIVPSLNLHQREDSDVKYVDSDIKDTKSDPGFCTGSDTGSDGVFAEDSISDTSSALGDKKDAPDSLLDTNIRDGEPYDSSSFNNTSTSRLTQTLPISINSTNAYDKAIEDYKHFAESSARKRNSSVASEEEKKDDRKPTPIVSTKISDKLHFFHNEMDRDTASLSKSSSKRKTPKIEIDKRRSMFELRDIDHIEKKSVHRRSLDVSNSLKNKVASFENIPETTKSKGVTPPRDLKFKEKLQNFSFHTKTDYSVSSRKAYLNRDKNFSEKLQTFSRMETEIRKSPERKANVPFNTHLKTRIASFERLSPEHNLGDRSVSMECLSTKKKSPAVGADYGYLRRTPSTPFMVVEVDLPEEEEEKTCIKERISREYRSSSQLRESTHLRKDSHYKTSSLDAYAETLSKESDTLNDITQTPHLSEKPYLTESIRSEIPEDSPLSAISKVPDHSEEVLDDEVKTDTPKSSEEESSLEDSKLEYGDDDIDEVIQDYEYLSAATTIEAISETHIYEKASEMTTLGKPPEPPYEEAENYYKNIMDDEPLYENIYEKVDENPESLNGDDTSPENHHYQTLEDVRTEVENMTPPLPPKLKMSPSVESTLSASQTSSQNIKKEIRKKMSDFLGTSPQVEEEVTMQLPPDVNELLRLERQSERLILQKQANQLPRLIPDADSHRAKYTWEDRMRADGSKPKELDESADHLDFHFELEQLEREMVKHDRDMLQRAGASDNQMQNLPPPAQYENGILEPPTPVPIKATVSTTPSLPIQEFYTAPAYKAPTHAVYSHQSDEPKLTNGAYHDATPIPFVPTHFSHSQMPVSADQFNHNGCSDSPPELIPRKKKSPIPLPVETLYQTHSKDAYRYNETKHNGSTESLSASPSGQPLSKQSIIALSAIPKPRLTDNDSWIMKKKAESSKRDYSNHWLIQEAEQRRIEEQDRLARQKNPSNHLNRTQVTQVTQVTPPNGAYHSHYQNIRSSFNSHPSPHSPVNSTSSNPLPQSAPRGVAQNNIVNKNNNNNDWRKQTKTYQPLQDANAAAQKPLPDSIINTLTQRVNNKNKGINNSRSDDYHDYMNTESLQGPAPPIHESPPTAVAYQPPPPPQPPQQSNQSPSQQTPTNDDQRLLSVSGKKKCSHCGEELGRGAAMIIESLRLFYHIPCFKCCVCSIQLGNGTSGADVRVRNHKLHCHNCYSNDEGMKFSKV